jgi:hypothetical protein
MESWTKFCKAFGGMLSSEFYAEEYPDFVELADNEDDSVNKLVVTNVNKAIEDRINPTYCLLVFVNTCLDNPRYANESVLEITYVIDKFMLLGGYFPYHLLFNSRSYGDLSIEDECVNHNVRGIMIDFLKPEIATEYAYWPEIPATYWEDIESDDWRESLKFNSKFLQTL